MRTVLGQCAVGMLVVFVLSANLAWPAANPVAPVKNPHGPLQMECGKCHTAASWVDIRGNPEFDHNKTKYPLRGMHARVRCELCHSDPLFANVGRKCQDCHADIHRRRNGAQCDMCHQVNGWQVSVHSVNEHQDRFPLIGAHAVTDCYSCHKVGAVGQFNRQGLSTDCVSCHRKAFLQTTAPNHRASRFSLDCRQCHMSMDTWRIAGAQQGRFRR